MYLQSLAVLHDEISLFVCKNAPGALVINLLMDAAAWFAASGIFIYEYVLHHIKKEVRNFCL